MNNKVQDASQLKSSSQFYEQTGKMGMTKENYKELFDRVSKENPFEVMKCVMPEYYGKLFEEDDK